ncbi:MAG: hypothetical protein AB8B91_02040 [Rubripirellula sp.]
MLELFALIALCVALGKLVRERGHKPFLLQTLLVVLWFLGQFISGFLMIAAYQLAEDPESVPGVNFQLAVIAGALGGAIIAFLFALRLPDQYPRSMADRSVST